MSLIVRFADGKDRDSIIRVVLGKKNKVFLHSKDTVFFYSMEDDTVMELTKDDAPVMVKLIFKDITRNFELYPGDLLERVKYWYDYREGRVDFNEMFMYTQESRGVYTLDDLLNSIAAKESRELTEDKYITAQELFALEGFNDLEKLKAFHSSKHIFKSKGKYIEVAYMSRLNEYGVPATVYLGIVEEVLPRLWKRVEYIDPPVTEPNAISLKHKRIKRLREERDKIEKLISSLEEEIAKEE